MGTRLYTSKWRVLVSGVFTVALLLTQLSGGAYAAKKNTTPVGSDNSFRLSPLRTNVTLKPGETGAVDVSITNLTSAPTKLNVVENDFIAADEKGTPALVLDNNAYAPTHSLKRFMIPLSSITVPAGATSTVTVTIKVPKTAQAGGYFGAIRFVPVSSNGQLAIGTNVASLILLTIPGPTVEQLTLSNFDVQQNGGTASNFRTPSDLSLLVRFENKGNLQEAPFGQIYVQKGKKVTYKYNFNQEDPKAEILPDSARRWTVPIKGMGKFGKYTVGATFTYGTKGQAIQISKTIWIVPTIYIIAIVIIVLLLILIFGGGYWFLKSYKRRILRSSRRRY